MILEARYEVQKSIQGKARRRRRRKRGRRAWKTTRQRITRTRTTEVDIRTRFGTRTQAARW